MQKLVIKTTIMSEDGKPKVSWKCISCDHSRKGSPQEIRVLKHSATCKKLPVHLRNEAITASKDTSLGAQLVEAPPVEEQPHMDEPPAKWPKNQVALNVAPYRDVGQKKQEEERQIFQMKADHIIMRLICVCGFVPTIIDSDEWKELMVHLNPHYHATSCNTFTNNYIPKEAVFVHQQQLKELKKQTNLTLTFDGTNT
jgi:hypothetical protein